MATIDDYAEWIVNNADKKGTPEFDTVAEAYRQAKAETASPAPYDVPSPVASLLNIGQAVSFGFGDEIAQMRGYDKDRYNATLDQFRKDYPFAARLGPVSGALLTPGLSAKMFGGAPYLAAATTGLVQGALQGAGDAEKLELVPQRASLGGLFGMGLAPLVLYGLSTGGNVLSAFGSRLSPTWAQKIARRRIATAFERDSTNATDIGKRMADIGPEARIVDAAGENTRSALDVNATLPGKTQNDLESVIRSRQATSFDRLNSQVVDQINGGYGRSAITYKALADQQKAIAAPLYKKAHSQSIPADKTLIEILDSAKRLGAYREARTIATAERQPFTLDRITEGSVKTVTNPMIETNPMRVVTDASKLSIKDIDYVKRGLDAMIERETNEFGKVSSKGRAFISLKNDLLKHVDSLSPDFAAARKAFAGPESLKSAIQKGENFWREAPVRIEDEIADMSQSEVAAFRIGASEALRTMIGSQGGRTKLLGMWKDNNIKERMKALLGDDLKYADIERRLAIEQLGRGVIGNRRWLLGDDLKYADIERRIANELQLKRIEQLGRGSQTARRIFANEDQAVGVAADAINMGLNKTGVLTGLLSAMKKNAPRITTPEPVRDAMGRILLGQYQPAEMKALLAAQEAIRRQRALMGVTTGVGIGKGTAYGAGFLDE
jgi:hypothetical protein